MAYLLRKTPLNILRLTEMICTLFKHGEAFTCVGLAAFLWAHRGGTGLGNLLLLAFPTNGTEGGGVAQGGESGL